MIDQEINKDLEKKLNESNPQENKEVIELSAKMEMMDLKYREERFLWILSFFLLLDLFILKDCKNTSWSFCVLIGIIEITMLLVFAERLKIKLPAELLEKYLNNKS